MVLLGKQGSKKQINVMKNIEHQTGIEILSEHQTFACLMVAEIYLSK